MVTMIGISETVCQPTRCASTDVGDVNLTHQSIAFIDGWQNEPAKGTYNYNCMFLSSQYVPVCWTAQMGLRFTPATENVYSSNFSVAWTYLS